MGFRDSKSLLELRLSFFFTKRIAKEERNVWKHNEKKRIDNKANRKSLLPGKNLKKAILPRKKVDWKGIWIHEKVSAFCLKLLEFVNGSDKWSCEKWILFPTYGSIPSQNFLSSPFQFHYLNIRLLPFFSLTALSNQIPI